LPRLLAAACLQANLGVQISVLAYGICRISPFAN
jgi:hypothetical protein